MSARQPVRHSQVNDFAVVLHGVQVEPLPQAVVGEVAEEGESKDWRLIYRWARRFGIYNLKETKFLEFISSGIKDTGQLRGDQLDMIAIFMFSWTAYELLRKKEI